MSSCARLALALILLVAPLLNLCVEAQVVNDGATNTLNNVTISLSGNVTVGTNGSSTLLIITNGALLTNTVDGFIGLNTNANANAVLVTGFNSRWFMGRILGIGNSGSFNNLLVTNGGQVASQGPAFVGRETNANANAATVTGLNSAWINKGNLYVGSNGSFNTVVINNGGTVAAVLSHLGHTAGSFSNQLTVIGANSVWTNSSDVTVGYGGSFNTLLITNGGRVAGFYGGIGSSLGASNNQVIVTDPSSTWTNQGALQIGFQGCGNSLLITNGGRMANGAYSVLGSQSNAINNEVTVTGPNSRWENGDFLVVGEYGNFNTLLVNNGSWVTDTAGGLGQSSSYNKAIVSGSNSVWTNTYGMYVGWVGSSNTLLISNGGRVANGAGYVGHIGDNNQVTVTGSNSVWINNSGFLYLGEYGSSNTLLISNGGAAQSINAYVGLESFSSNNHLHVDNGTFAATRLSGDAVLDVRRGQVVFDDGFIVADNLLLTNGAQSQFSFNAGTLITRTATISDGQNFVVGANTGFGPATWDVRSNATPTVLSNGLDIGLSAANATLLITNGATLSVGTTTFDINLSTRLGVDAGSTHNAAIVTGPGSLWTNRSDLDVGCLGSFNTLLITNGGRVKGGNVFVGNGSSANNNLATVTDSNSVWANRGSLFIGNYGSRNALLITNRGQAANLYGYVGNHAGANNNQVTVTGPNTVWTNNGDLAIGNSGSFNTMLITNGGLVTNWAAQIGWSPGANNNQVTVTGPNSAWTNNGDLWLGAFGSSNTLLITNGGRVASRSGYIGAYFNGTNNQVTVDGPNSVWANSGEIVIGYLNSSSTLLIANGGTVQASNVCVGLEAGFDNLISVGNGTLSVISVGSPAMLDVRRGSAVFNGGTITADQLLLTNGVLSVFTFNAGTLNTRAAAVANGAPFTVGNGIGAATYRMIGLPVSTHNFANGLTVANNSSLSGNGTIDGVVTIASGGTLSPGDSIGTIVLNNTPFMQGKVFMEISKSGTTRTNDQVQVNGALTYGGSLTVSNLGPTALAAGDTFQLFSATSYAGTFSPLILPALGTGLVWTNKLLANGRIAVVAANNPQFNNAKVVGTNLVLNITGGVPNGGWTLLTATNVAVPLTNWFTNTTGFFDDLGNLTLTNAISPIQPKRFFDLREP